MCRIIVQLTSATNGLRAITAFNSSSGRCRRMFSQLTSLSVSLLPHISLPSSNSMASVRAGSATEITRSQLAANS